MAKGVDKHSLEEIIMKALWSLVVALILSAAPVSQAELTTKKVLTLGLAKKLVAAAEAEAKKRGATVVIAVVDDGGQLILLERLDDTQVASVEVAMGKARTAAIFRRPSKVFEDQVKNGRAAALALPGATPLQGGIPITVEGKVIGAIGASGNSPQEDEEIALVQLRPQRLCKKKASEVAGASKIAVGETVASP
jgi:glc operon protein GlcG